MTHINPHTFTSADATAQALALAVRDALIHELKHQERVSLAVSGGSTPLPFFDALSVLDAPWEQVDITLVDERWVDEDHSDSNAALVKRHLLQNKAASARFFPLKQPCDLQQGVAACRSIIQSLGRCIDVVVLGMGGDGHTASWFPHSAALSECFDDDERDVCTVGDAPANWPERMTLTWPLVRRCSHLFLHFFGCEKTHVYAQALEHLDDANSMPVRKVLGDTQRPINLYCGEE